MWQAKLKISFIPKQLMLNDLEKLVQTTQVMRFTEAESLAYLESRGHHVDKAEFYKIVGRLSSLVKADLQNIVENFHSRHADRVNQVYTVLEELWENYQREPDPTKKARILSGVLEAQPYISAYDEMTINILEKFNYKKDNTILPGDAEQKGV